MTIQRDGDGYATTTRWSRHPAAMPDLAAVESDLNQHEFNRLTNETWSTLLRLARLARDDPKVFEDWPVMGWLGCAVGGFLYIAESSGLVSDIDLAGHLSEHAAVYLNSAAELGGTPYGNGE